MSVEALLAPTPMAPVPTSMCSLDDANGTFPVDPALEAMISQMHSALATITATARASGGHRKALEAAHSKLEVYQSWGYDSHFPSY